jgi:hypothetical protein
MSPKDQERWQTDLSYTDLTGKRTNDRELRRRYSRKFQQFLHKQDADIVMRILRRYVHHCIPVPVKSELSFWAASCLPAYSHPGTTTVYSRININWQEVFTISREEKRMGFSWHLARSPLEEIYGKSLNLLRKKMPGTEIDDHAYTPGGQDQINLFTESINDAVALLSDGAVIKSARLFNMRLMRKGPCAYSRYHCFELADRLVAPL